MSLTFQLARGVLALALTCVLALTAWLAPSTGTTPRTLLISEVAVVCPAPPPVLRLALAPADLPPSHRANGSCRA